LYEVGYDNHAYDVDVFYSFGKAAIIFWSIIGFTLPTTPSDVDGDREGDSKVDFSSVG
jgi:hypothetical protein